MNGHFWSNFVAKNVTTVEQLIGMRNSSSKERKKTPQKQQYQQQQTHPTKTMT